MIIFVNTNVSSDSYHKKMLLKSMNIPLSIIFVLSGPFAEAMMERLKDKTLKAYILGLERGMGICGPEDPFLRPLL